MTIGLRTGLIAGGTAVLVALGGYTAVASGALPMPPAATGGPGAEAHTGMSGGMPGASRMAGSADYKFAVQMAAHHESAVEMARLAQDRAERPEVQALAEEIARSQTAEIEQLDDAAARLAPKVPAADSATGMHSGMGEGMGTDLSQLPAGENFDRAFLTAMIPHHEMGVHMAQMVQRHGSDPDVQRLAAHMVDVQTAEITQMQQWLAQWYGA